MSSTVVSRGTVTIDTERCKGCELCIAACRPGVLTMSEAVNPTGYRFPLLSPGCTACRACRDVCPDYCFEVFRFDTPVTDTPAAGTPAAGTPAAGTPAAGTPAAGTPDTGTPAAGTPDTGEA